jgi:hypothetical protein
MVSEEVRQDALSLLNNMIAEGEIEEVDRADGFIVLTTNAETYDIHINGPFPDVATAMAWADEHETDLNQGNPPDEIPFVTAVFPMITPS